MNKLCTQLARCALLHMTIFALCIPRICFGLTAETRTLVRCEFVYNYYAQYFQILNNEGAAKNLVARATRLTAAYMLLNLEDDIVSAEKLDQFRLIWRETKAQLELDPSGNTKQIAACDRVTPAMIKSVMNKSIVWQGKTYHELSLFLLEGALRNLGIK